MSATANLRRVAIFLLLAAVLLAALTPGMAGLLLGFLVTLSFAVAIFPRVPLPQADGQSYAQLAQALAVLSPRPPPAR